MAVALPREADTRGHTRTVGSIKAGKAFADILATAVAGRLWCGHACPQMVYTEMFMWTERRIEGDRTARMKRDAGGWTRERL